jgi:3-keto-5-aminohexanoate cleavage enzyme
MVDKLIITAAVTGSLKTRQQNPNIPYSPEEIAREAIESNKAGASVAHLHMRDPLTGAPRQEAALFEQAIRLIRKECDMIINITTGGAPGMSYEERMAVIPALAAEKETKPELATISAGSVNFGILNNQKKKFLLSTVIQSPWHEIINSANTMTKHGVTPEIEIYDVGHLNNANVLKDIIALSSPLYFQFVLGVLGAIPATVDNLLFLKNAMAADGNWSVCVDGLDIFTIAPTAIALGGHVRVGMEDCIYLSKGVLAESNAEFVRKIVRISNEMEREVAKPDDARKILHLPEKLWG